MIEQKFFTMSGPLNASMASMGATPEQIEAFKAAVGGISPPKPVIMRVTALKYLANPVPKNEDVLSRLRAMPYAELERMVVDIPFAVEQDGHAEWVPCDPLLDAVWNALDIVGEEADGVPAQELADGLVKIVPALDRRDPAELVPFVEEWLQTKRSPQNPQADSVPTV